MLKRVTPWLAAALFISGCAWIDDIGTVDKRGSYEITMTATSSDAETGTQAVSDRAVQCAEAHTTQSFEFFDVNNADDAIWRISMLDQSRSRIDATTLSIDFEPWALDNPDIPCPTPGELVGTDAEISLNGCVKASLLIGMCKPRQSFAITGTLKLDEFSDKRRQTVSGTIDGQLLFVRYIEGNDDTTVSQMPVGSITASFAFPVHAGVPWRR